MNIHIIYRFSLNDIKGPVKSLNSKKGINEQNAYKFRLSSLYKEYINEP